MVKEMPKMLMNGWKTSCSVPPPTLFLMPPLRSLHSSLKIRLKTLFYDKFSTSSKQLNSHHSPPTLLVNISSDAPFNSLFALANCSNVEALILQLKSSLILTSVHKFSIKPMKILGTAEYLEYSKLSGIASIGHRCTQMLPTTFVLAMNARSAALAKSKFPSPSHHPPESS